MRASFGKVLLSAGLFAGISGCVQIDTKIRLHEDGSATVTERLRISKYLIDLDVQQKNGGEKYTSLLSKEDALRRMKEMGEGITLVSHKLHTTEGNSRESLAVYKIPDLNKLIYASPLLAFKDYPGMNRIAFSVTPVMKSHMYGQAVAGQVRVTVFGLTAAGKKLTSIPGPRRKRGAPPPPQPDPLVLQAYRDVAPVFRDIMKDFRLRLRFETYCPVDRATFGVRGRMANPRYVDLINFTDKDLDRYGQKFVENEEIMLDVVRGDLGSDDIWNTVRGCNGNSTLPVFLPLGSSHYFSDYRYMKIHFAPSRDLFKKFFEGKQIDFSRRKDKALKLANFDQIGWKGDPKK